MTNPLDDRLLALTAIVTVAFQLSFFLITYALRFDKVTDFAGTTNFLLLAVITLTVGGAYKPRQIVLSTCVFVWGVRLCAFLLYRILLWGEDRRFDDKRNNVARLAAFWILQAVWVWTVSLPITIVNSKEVSKPLNALDYVGWGIFALAALLEAVADQQKLNFKNTPQSRGRWTDVGVWKWSRHPNFFAEMTVWWGLFLSSINDLRGAEFAAIASPIFITLLLLFVSGIPILEKSWDEKYGRKDGYAEWKNMTSVLIPIPPSLYVGIPKSIKSTLLLDFKMYNPGPKPDVDQAITKKPTEETSLVEEAKHTA
ncbi:hypothetical protein BWQ96_09436 [Gracilariopsis chorda]|uniref:Uncharacterized protein n=1 Tax=Gracilariopsis chorda TaxID=448386 RepID=A0A2V3IFH8_9FLOR|nr:hypothetical protein BWQ96_09436 [Gracilariopsis chorda]|eukprot:PXF40846.1 hypothetical protein BWQ96_09436 [Gracilariopsis chorda]